MTPTPEVLTGEPEPVFPSPYPFHVLAFFKYDHLPQELQAVSKPFCDLALSLVSGTVCQETGVALRKLLESKDAAVRAHLFCGGVK